MNVVFSLHVPGTWRTVFRPLILPGSLRLQNGISVSVPMHDNV